MRKLAERNGFKHEPSAAAAFGFFKIHCISGKPMRSLSIRTLGPDAKSEHVIHPGFLGTRT